MEFIEELNECTKYRDMCTTITKWFITLKPHRISKTTRIARLIKINNICVQELLWYAIDYQKLIVVTILLKVGFKTGKPRRCLEFAVQKYFSYDTRNLLIAKRILQKLIKHKVEHSGYEIYYAMKFRRETNLSNTDVLKLLLDYPECDVNFPITLAHTGYESYSRTTNLGTAVYNNDYDAFELLVDHGADINAIIDVVSITKSYYSILNYIMGHAGKIRIKMLNKLFENPDLEYNGGYYHYKDKKCLDQYKPPIMRLTSLHTYSMAGDMFFQRCVKYMVCNVNDTSILEPFDQYILSALKTDPVNTEQEIPIHKKLVEKLQNHAASCHQHINDIIKNKNVSNVIYDYCS